MSEAKKLTAKEEEWLRRASATGYGALDSEGVARLFATLDAERAKVEALEADCRAYRKTMEMIEQAGQEDAKRITAAEARATAAEAEADKVRDLIDFWFSPWGAYKSERWEEISGDQPFSPDAMLAIIRAALAKEKPDAAQ